MCGGWGGGGGGGWLNRGFMVYYMNSKLMWCMNFLQVEDYRNSSMIECKMGISADTLVLIHSSSKVSRTTLSYLVLSMFLLTINVEMSFM